jgi:hypothetical protein
VRLNPGVEAYRVKDDKYWGTDGGMPFGLFYIPYRTVKLKVVACDGLETKWDHVSVSLPNRCPNWDEMCLVKSLFWGEGETVFQFHPRKDEYVNNHEYCLHMWKPTEREIELPPSILVGIK